VPIRRSTILAAVFLAATLAASTAARAAGATHPALAALEKGGAWKLLAPPRTFGPENLYEEIDGEAELFLPYGMKQLTVGIVAERSAPGDEVRVELYRMGSPRDAFGVYSQHRYPDQEIASVPPSEVVLSETSADFYRGETFVRIRARPGEASRRLVARLSKDLVASLPGDGGFPAEARALDRFPGRVRGSVIYQKRAMLGYECLAPGFEGKFSGASAAGRLLLLPPVPGKEGERMARLARELPEYTKISDTLSRAKLPSGALWLSPAGSCVVGVAGELQREEAVRLLAALAGEAGGICGPSSIIHRNSRSLLR
jgi:hypothetical protein